MVKVEDLQPAITRGDNRHLVEHAHVEGRTDASQVAFQHRATRHREIEHVEIGSDQIGDIIDDSHRRCRHMDGQRRRLLEDVSVVTDLPLRSVRRDDLDRHPAREVCARDHAGNFLQRLEIRRDQLARATDAGSALHEKRVAFEGDFRARRKREIRGGDDQAFTAEHGARRAARLETRQRSEWPHRDEFPESRIAQAARIRQRNASNAGRRQRRCDKRERVLIHHRDRRAVHRHAIQAQRGEPGFKAATGDRHRLAAQRGQVVRFDATDDWNRRSRRRNSERMRNRRKQPAALFVGDARRQFERVGLARHETARRNELDEIATGAGVGEVEAAGDLCTARIEDLEVIPQTQVRGEDVSREMNLHARIGRHAFVARPGEDADH